MARADIAPALAAGLTLPPARGDGRRHARVGPHGRPATGRRSTAREGAGDPCGRDEPRSAVKREPQRGRYDRETIDAILDEALALPPRLRGRRPAVRDPDAPRARRRPPLRARLGGEPDAAARCVGRRPRLRDGHALRRARARALGVQPLGQLPLGRRARHGDARRRTTRSSRRCARSPSSSRPAAGTRRGSRPTQELKATWILSLPLDEASAKVRSGPPEDDAGGRRPARCGPASSRCTSPPSRASTTGGACTTAASSARGRRRLRLSELR